MTHSITVLLFLLTLTRLPCTLTQSSFSNFTEIPGWSGHGLEPSGVVYIPGENTGSIVVVSDEGAVCIQEIGTPDREIPHPHPPKCTWLDPREVVEILEASSNSKMSDARSKSDSKGRVKVVSRRAGFGYPKASMNKTIPRIRGGVVDLEAIFTIPGFNDSAFLGIEYPPSIIEFSLSKMALTGKSWDISSFIPATSKHGMEGAAWVPFPANMEPDNHGLLFASSQDTGHIYVIRVPFDGVVSGEDYDLVGELFPKIPNGSTDISAMSYSAELSRLFVLSDNQDMMLSYTITMADERSWSIGPHDFKQEGFAVWGKHPQISNLWKVVIADDAGNMWFADMPF